MDTETIMHKFAEKYGEINVEHFDKVLNYQAIDMPCAQIVLAGLLVLAEIIEKKEDNK